MSEQFMYTGSVAPWKYLYVPPELEAKARETVTDLEIHVSTLLNPETWIVTSFPHPRYHSTPETK